MKKQEKLKTPAVFSSREARKFMKEIKEYINKIRNKQGLNSL